MPEQNKFTKKKLIWIVVLGGFSILCQLYLLFDVEDWSHHRFEVLSYFLIILALVYAIYFMIKKYKNSH